MALRKWTWFCLTLGLLGMNGVTRYGFAAEEDRTPAIAAEFKGLSPGFKEWLDRFDDRLEQILKVKVK